LKQEVGIRFAPLIATVNAEQYIFFFKKNHVWLVRLFGRIRDVALAAWIVGQPKKKVRPWLFFC
jgi:hypothetical protein